MNDSLPPRQEPAVPPVAADPARAAAAGAEPPPADAAARTPWPLVLIAVVALSLLFGAWGLWTVLSSAGAGADPGERLAQLEQEVTTLARSDQISREANLQLQGALAERDEEIAGLRADLAFYERFVGATAQRRGLTVHELKLAPGGGQVWHATATLTQNLNRGEPSEGELRLLVEGTLDGRLQQLDWNALRQREDAPPLPYSFKYFQQVEGDIVLPAGFTPTRITARLQPRGGSPVEQSFAWSDATGRSAPDA
ncbi:DUF6776 family protein [Luteimonas huabeiensis]|uniref:DUF6776 family protein n=1 Tax=Luteimonas huabeiensis TaxID=1244513 RepID=UPI0004638193|nr:DUF6776 family protein [Luteimonas huabeiensis]